VKDKSENLSAWPLTVAGTLRCGVPGRVQRTEPRDPQRRHCQPHPTFAAINPQLVTPGEGTGPTTAASQSCRPGALTRRNDCHSPDHSQTMSFLTGLERFSFGHFYKYVAPTELMDAIFARQQHQMNATEITRFFLSHRGRPARRSLGGAGCFNGWSVEKIFNYVLVNCVHGNVFVARAPGEGSGSSTRNQPAGPIALAAIAWLDDAAAIKRKAELDLPQFSWEGFPEQQSRARQQAENRSLTVGAQLDSILIADVAGDGRLMAEILKQVMGRWCDGPWRCHPLPNIFQKRLFTYRRGKLVELSWATVRRFASRPVQSPQSVVRSSRSDDEMTVDRGLATVD